MICLSGKSAFYLQIFAKWLVACCTKPWGLVDNGIPVITVPVKSLLDMSVLSLHVTKSLQEAMAAVTKGNQKGKYQRMGSSRGRRSQRSIPQPVQNGKETPVNSKFETPL